MKKILFFCMAGIVSTPAFAKKIKFSVDMADEVVSPNGIHVMGDFQVLAGYASDWAPNLTELAQEGSTTIYSIVVDIPANTKYEYRFINGDQGYEAEYVPNESRLIDPDFDNRWIYLDSLDNTVFNLAPIKFGKNAPAGKFLLRFKVDMSNQLPIDLSNPANRPHVEGSFQGWSTTATALYAPNDTVYEYIAYVTAGTHQFKYINGNSGAKEETVPAACAVSGNRSVAVSADLVLDKVCFGACTVCGGPNGIPEKALVKKINVFPNPSSDYTTLRFEDQEINHTVTVKDITGKTVRVYNNYNHQELTIERDQLNAGIYFIVSQDSKMNSSTSKWVIQ
jgi:alpha-amylase